MRISSLLFLNKQKKKAGRKKKRREKGGKKEKWWKQWKERKVEGKNAEQWKRWRIEGKKNRNDIVGRRDSNTWLSLSLFLFLIQLLLQQVARVWNRRVGLGL